jgi:hypothetical protein
MHGALASVLLFFLYCEHSSLINLSANKHLIVWVFTGLVATNIVNYYDLFPTPTASVLVVRHKVDFLSCNNLWILNLIAILSFWIISDYRNMSSRGGRAGGRGDKSTGKLDQGRAKCILTLPRSCRAALLNASFDRKRLLPDALKRSINRARVAFHTDLGQAINSFSLGWAKQ